MNNTGGALSFDAYIGDTDFNRTIQSMNRKLEGLSGKTVSESKKMESAFSNMGRLAAGGIAAAGLASLPQQIVRVRGEFQQLEIAFGTMLQSKVKADKLMAEVTQFAALTPYGLKDTAAATKQLLAYGESADTVIQTMTRLGDIASGIGAPLGDIAYLYGTTMTQGRLYTQDLNQFTGRGIPMIRELAKIFKVAESEVKGLVETGKVGFPEVQKVIENLTNSGSMFGGLMEAQSKSLGGLQAQLGDAVDAMFNDIGKSQEGLLTETFKGAIGVVENYEKVIDVLKVVVVAYGAYRAALMLTAAIETYKQISLFATEYMAMGRALGFATANQIAFNGATLANPYVIAAVALTALVTAFVVFGDNVSEAEKIQRKFNDAAAAAEDAMSSEQAKIISLTAQINNEKISRDQRNKALQELINLSPTHLSALTLENIKTAEGTTAINNYIEAKKKQLQLKEIDSQLEESIKRQNAAQRGENDISIWDKIALSAGAANGGGDYSKTAAAERKRLNGDLAKSESDLQAKLIERIGVITGVDKAVVKSAETTAKTTRKTVENYNDEIKALKDKQDKASSKADFSALEKDIAALEKKRNLITGGKQKKVLEKDKPQPFGSLDYWEQVAQKANEIISKTPSDNTSVIAKQQAIAKNSQEKAEAIRKQLAVKTFDEELQYKKSQYELYERWVRNMGEETAKSQFSALTQSGSSFADYLNSEIKKFETQKAAPGIGLIASEEQQLEKLKNQLAEISGVDTPLQKFQKELDNARESSGSLTEELIKLQLIQSGLNPNDNSTDGTAKRQVLIERELEVQKQRKQMLADFLVNVTGSESKQTEIVRHYTDIRAALEKKTLDLRSKGYQKALAAINKAEQEELSDDKDKAAQASREYKSFIKVAQKSQEELTKINIEGARADFARFTEGLDKESDAYKTHLANLRKIENEYLQKRIALLGIVGNFAGQLGEIMSDMGSGLAEAGAALSGIASQVGNISSALNGLKKGEDGKMTMSANGYAAAIQGVFNIIGMVTQASKKRREAERQFYQDTINYENQYRLAINERIGTQYSQNPFYTDYKGKITAGVQQYEDAFEQYQKAIDKLNQGRAKDGQKNAVDGKSVGTGAAAGVSIGLGAAVGYGALIGTAVGPVGTAVGAAIGLVIGGVIGLFAGKKKKDTWGALLEQYPGLVKEGADGWAEIDAAMAKSLITNNKVDDATKSMLETALEYKDQMKEAETQIWDTIVSMTGQIGDQLTDSMVTAFQNGTDAAQAFGKSVGDIIADVVKKMVLIEFLQPSLDRLKSEIKESWNPITGDMSIVDDLDRYKDYGLPGFQAGMEFLNQMDKWGESQGYDNLFGKVSNANGDQAMQGVIKGVSEETVSVLIGQTNAIRIYQAQMANTMQISAGHLSQIVINTSYTRLLVDTNSKLDRLIDQSNSSLRGWGFN